MFLLICQPLVLAEEEGGINNESLIKYAENSIASRSIASDIFDYHLKKEYAYVYRIWAFLNATGYKDLADEVLKDTKLHKIVDLDLFYKHNKKYKYNVSETKMFASVMTTLDSMVSGYKIGMLEILIIIFNKHKDVADNYKDVALKMYEKYLEDKKKSEDKKATN